MAGAAVKRGHEIGRKGKVYPSVLRDIQVSSDGSESVPPILITVMPFTVSLC
jgi:hypothetical protein